MSDNNLTYNQMSLEFGNSRAENADFKKQNADFKKQNQKLKEERVEAEVKAAALQLRNEYLKVKILNPGKTDSEIHQIIRENKKIGELIDVK